MTLRTALVGCGRWGTKLLGALGRHPAFEVVSVVDSARPARSRARALAPTAHTCATLTEGLATLPSAVIVATPSSLHAAHALEALSAAADVLVEKPLCLSAADAARLCTVAAAHGRVGMVGHVLRYHPALERLVDLVHEGAVGTPQRLVARRFTQSGSALPLWTLAAHDLATLHAIDPSPATGVSATETDTGGTRLTELEVELSSGLRARFELSTTAPAPERTLLVTGDRGMVRSDELAPERDRAELTWCAFDRGNASPAAFERCEWQPCGVAAAEPLLAELTHFAHCVTTRALPRSSFEEGHWVVEVLERAAGVLRSGARSAERAPAADEATA